MTRPIVFLDTETTGLHPERQVWEVGMIRREVERPEEALSIMIADVDLSHADPAALAIGRFYERHPLYGGQAAIDPHIASAVSDPFSAQVLHKASIPRSEPDQETVAAVQAARVVERWTRGAVIIGAVPSFDTEGLGALLRQYGLLPAWHHRLIDIESVAVGWLGDKRIQGGAEFASRWLIEEGRKSDELAEACGVAPLSREERHTALGDARWVRDWWDRMMWREEK